MASELVPKTVAAATEDIVVFSCWEDIPDYLQNSALVSQWKDTYADADNKFEPVEVNARFYLSSLDNLLDDVDDSRWNVFLEMARYWGMAEHPVAVLEQALAYNGPLLSSNKWSELYPELAHFISLLRELSAAGFSHEFFRICVSNEYKSALEWAVKCYSFEYDQYIHGVIAIQCGSVNMYKWLYEHGLDRIEENVCILAAQYNTSLLMHMCENDIITEDYCKEALYHAAIAWNMDAMKYIYSKYNDWFISSDTDLDSIWCNIVSPTYDLDDMLKDYERPRHVVNIDDLIQCVSSISPEYPSLQEYSTSPPWYVLFCPENTELVKGFHRHGMYDYLFVRGSSGNQMMCMDALQYNNFELLDYLHSQKCLFLELSVEAVLSLPRLKYIVEHGVPITKEMYTMAVNCGDIECVRYLKPYIFLPSSTSTSL